MAPDERQLAVDQLIASETKLHELVTGLTKEQWAFREAPERWSIAEIIEHVMAVENRITRAIQKLIEQPAPEGDRPNTTGKDALVMKRATDRSAKLSAPEQVRPVGKFADTDQMMTEFAATRARTVRFATETQADLRSRSIPHMAFGDLDCYQWLLLLGKHGVRHAQQIEEIKADPAYPSELSPAQSSSAIV
jgi:hypothetical protein